MERAGIHNKATSSMSPIGRLDLENKQLENILNEVEELIAKLDLSLTDEEREKKIQAVQEKMYQIEQVKDDPGQSDEEAKKCVEERIRKIYNVAKNIGIAGGVFLGPVAQIFFASSSSSSFNIEMEKHKDHLFSLRLRDDREWYLTASSHQDISVAKQGEYTNTSPRRRQFIINCVRGEEDTFELQLKDDEKVRDVYVTRSPDNDLCVAERDKYTNESARRRQFRIINTVEGGYYNLLVEHREVYASNSLFPLYSGRLFAKPRDTNTNISDNRREFCIHCLNCDKKIKSDLSKKSS